MNTETKSFEPLGELYIETLCQNAYYEGAAASIRDAVLDWHGVLSMIDPGVQNTSNSHAISASHKLIHDAMGFMERTLSWISEDWLKGGADWKQIDAFFESSEIASSEISWVIAQLHEQSERAWDAYTDHAKADWAHDISMAATFFKAAAMILSEAKA